MKKPSKSNSPFPLNYFIQSVRSRIFYITITAILVSLIHLSLKDNIYKAVIFTTLALWVVATVLSFWRIKPFSKILKRLQNIDINLDHADQIQLLYKKNEWEVVNGMLNFIEKDILNQQTKLEDQDIQYGRVFEAVPSAIVVVDKFQNIIQSNKEFSTLFQNQDIETKLWKIFSHDELLKKFDKAIENQNEMEFLNYKDEKSSYYFDIKISPFKNNENETIGAIGIFHNISARKLSEKMRVDFVANVSHEIRTPLTSIKGYAQLLEAQTSELPQNLKMLTEKINSNTEKLKDLFENLLKLSKIESQYEINKKQLCLNSLVKKVHSDIQAKYQGKESELTVDIENLPIWADEMLFEQVISNLFDNAFKYSRGKVNLNITQLHTSGSSEITIKDNGAGIAQDQIARIFERFYRIQDEKYLNIEGSGLGLSIVKHIINKHNGEIQVSSKLGEGSQFMIKLPLES